MNANAAPRQQWHAVVLAPARPGDAVCRAYGLAHRCLLPVAGEPMLARVARTLARHPAIGRILLVIGENVPYTAALGSLVRRMEIVKPRKTTAQSVAAAVELLDEDTPVLVTTADHALLDKAMIDHFLAASQASRADATIGLVRAENVLERYPHTAGTILTFARDRVLACNLYGLLTPRGRDAIDVWEDIEANHRQPLKLATAFGLTSLVRHLTGTLDLETAFRLVSRRIGATARPVLMGNPEAAIGIDRHEDKALIEEILTRH